MGEEERILGCLRRVDAQRAARQVDPALGARVVAIKHYQSRRFERTYADLLSDPRYRAAARFFLEELYGPYDFAARDAQFARIVPALVRLFPQDVVETVAVLAELHALSEELDSAMARVHGEEEVTAVSYSTAWRLVGRPDAREEQIRLMAGVGRALDSYTRNPLLRHSLRLMRGPAKVAGLGSLQAFLESGFDTFRAMRGAETFLRTIVEREGRLSTWLFGCPPSDPTWAAMASGQLP